ncbi:hypothetical protein ScPMuIL_007867 [Solemya velum]
MVAILTPIGFAAQDEHITIICHLYASDIWSRAKHATEGVRLLSTLTVGLLGCGGIGKIVAEHCKAMGMTVWGMTRTPVDESRRCDAVDVYRTTDRLPELLAVCDYVVNILPSTKETTDLLSGGILSNCRERKSYFINIGRGDVVSEDSLVEAINKNWISGAALDVCKEEPLPQESRLWSLPNVLVTPHVAWRSNTLVQDHASAFAENYKRFIEGDPLIDEYFLDQPY